jgi:Tfp pilus assembly protein PilO
VKPRKRPPPLWRVGLLAAGALLALNAVAFLAFTLPRLDRSHRAETHSQELAQVLARQQAEFERLHHRAEAIEANVRDARRFFSEIVRPLPEALASDLDAVETAVRESRLRAERRGYDTRPLRGVPLTRYSIRLPLAGPSTQIGTLLRQLERSPRFIVIERIAMRDDNQAGQSTFDVELSTYYRSEATPSPATTTGRAAGRPLTAGRR